MTIGHFQSTINVFAAQGINLSGTSGTPIVATAIDTQPAAAVAGWRFLATGNMQRSSGNPDLWNPWEPTPDEWADPAVGSPGQNHWIRFTYNAGDASNGGDTVGAIWHAMSSTREVRWERTTIGTIAGSVKVDIATDSGGSNIVATGYYGGSAEQETGA